MTALNRAERRAKPKVKNNSKDKSAQEKAQAFLEEHTALVEKHGIQFTAKLEISDSGIFPKLGLMLSAPEAKIEHRDKNGALKQIINEKSADQAG